MYKAIMIYANFIFGFAASTLAAECKDGICPLPAGEEATYTVLSPVPESAVEPIKPATRLKSLDVTRKEKSDKETCTVDISHIGIDTIEDED